MDIFWNYKMLIHYIGLRATLNFGGVYKNNRATYSLHADVWDLLACFLLERQKACIYC